ncbi:flagellar hook protein FlgE [Propionivibrio sp.]|uniref:flagellar hook protein FlgE n=1 Tax=Propionivibrio sp. TaxID=2212460 RepID=UPI003BF1A5C6
MAFQQGLSGLNAASKALDVTSNNVANAATVGFKSAQAHFADIFAASLGSGGSAPVGIGTSVGAVQQQFTQGNLTTTNNPLDISINGNGFYRMSDNGSITYSRAGQFHLDKSGYVIDDSGRQLTGYLAVQGTTVVSAPVPLLLSSANIDPVATGASVGGSFTGVQASLNFDSRDLIKTVPFAFTSGSGGIGGVVDPLSYNFSTSTSVYDSLGNAHTLTMYAVKGSAATDPLDIAAVTAASAATAAAATAVNAANTAVSAGAAAAAAAAAVIAVPPTGTQAAADAAAAAALVAAAAATTAAAAATTAATAADTAAAAVVIPDVYSRAATAAALAATSAAAYATPAAAFATTPVAPTPDELLTGTATSVLDIATADATAAAASASAYPSQWNMYTSLDGTNPSNINGGTPLVLKFDSYGKMVNAPSQGSPLVINLNKVMADLGQANSAATPFEFNLDFASSTQFGAAFGTNNLLQDGYTSGRLTGVNVDPGGAVRGNYSNGQSKNLGQVALASFTNPNGLISLGGSQWAESSASGTALVGAPNTGTLGVLQSATVEESNVDLTAELVNMITQQRNYQANAQSIKTQDQLMQTLINLR